MAAPDLHGEGRRVNTSARPIMQRAGAGMLFRNTNTVFHLGIGARRQASSGFLSRLRFGIFSLAGQAPMAMAAIARSSSRGAPDEA